MTIHDFYRPEDQPFLRRLYETCRPEFRALLDEYPVGSYWLDPDDATRHPVALVGYHVVRHEGPSRLTHLHVLLMRVNDPVGVSWCLLDEPPLMLAAPDAVVHPVRGPIQLDYARWRRWKLQ